MLPDEILKLLKDCMQSVIDSQNSTLDILQARSMFRQLVDDIAIELELADYQRFRVLKHLGIAYKPYVDSTTVDSYKKPAQ